MRSAKGVAAAGAASCVAAVLVAAPSWANGRFPNANQIVVSPSNPNLIVGHVTYAILPSTGPRRPRT